MKKTLKMFLILSLAIVLVACKEKEDTYETFKDQHLTNKTAFKQIQSEYYLYFYSEDCPICNAIKDLVFAQARSKTRKLYFIDEKDVKDILNITEDKEYSNVGAKAFNELKVRGFPTMFLIKDGVVAGQHVGESAIRKELE